MSDSNPPHKNIGIVEQLDHEALESFLRLLRDKYRLADAANHHLEHNENTSGISVAITNQRDVVSHFITALHKPDLSREKQLEQVSNAEEHLRRAIIEPYELSVNLRLEKVFEALVHYKDRVLPRAVQPGFASAPSVREIEATLRTIVALRNTGRSKKSKNIWDADWEDGVKAFVQAYELARELGLKVDEYLVRVRQIEFGEESRNLSQQSLTVASNAEAGIRHLNRSHIVVAIIVAIGALAIDHFLRWLLH